MKKKHIAINDQDWFSREILGKQTSECNLWEGQDVHAGFYRVEKDLQFPQHQHDDWAHLLVLEGKLRVDVVDGESNVVGKGEYYFVDPGETHVETALEDTLIYIVTTEEERNKFTIRRAPPAS